MFLGPVYLRLVILSYQLQMVGMCHFGNYLLQIASVNLTSPFLISLDSRQRVRRFVLLNNRCVNTYNNRNQKPTHSSTGHTHVWSVDSEAMTLLNRVIVEWEWSGDAKTPPPPPITQSRGGLVGDDPSNSVRLGT